MRLVVDQSRQSASPTIQRVRDLLGSFQSQTAALRLREERQHLPWSGVEHAAQQDQHLRDLCAAIWNGLEPIEHFALWALAADRRAELRASPVLQKRASEHPKVNFIWNTVATEVLGTDRVEALRLKNVQSGQETVLETDGVFIFIGHTPNTQIFKGQLEMDSLGYLKIDEKMQTSVPGVFAGGEVADPHFRQVVTSAGMGAAAAIQATRYLESLEK